MPTIVDWKKSLKKAEEKNDANEVARLCNVIGVMYREEGKADIAVAYHMREIEISKALKDKEGLCIAHQFLGLCYIDLNDFNNGIHEYNKHLQMSRDLQLPVSEQRALCNLGNAYFKRGAALYNDQLQKIEILEAIEYFQNSLTLAQKLQASVSLREKLSMICDAWINLGQAYSSIEEFENAKYYFEQALELLQQPTKNNENKKISTSNKKYKVTDNTLESLSKVYSGLGMIFLRSKDFKLAEEFLLKELKIQKHAHFDDDHGEVYSSLGELFMEQGQFQKALTYYKLHQKISKLDRYKYDIINIENANTNVLYANSFIKRQKQIALLANSLKRAERNNHELKKNDLHQIATLLSEQKCYDESIIYWKQLLNITSKNDFINQAIIYHEIGNELSNLNQFLEATKCYEEELKLLESIQTQTDVSCNSTINESNIISSRISLAIALKNCKTENQKDLIAVFEEILEFAKEANSINDQISAIEHLIELYEKTGLIKKSIEALNELKHLVSIQQEEEEQNITIQSESQSYEDMLTLEETLDFSDSDDDMNDNNIIINNKKKEENKNRKGIAKSLKRFSSFSYDNNNEHIIPSPPPPTTTTDTSHVLLKSSNNTTSNRKRTKRPTVIVSSSSDSDDEEEQEEEEINSPPPKKRQRISNSSSFKVSRCQPLIISPSSPSSPLYSNDKSGGSIICSPDEDYASYSDDDKYSTEEWIRSMLKAREDNDIEAEGDICNMLGRRFMEEGKIYEAIEFHQRDLEISISSEDTMYPLQNLGKCYTIISKFENAIRCHRQHLEKAQKCEDIAQMQEAYCNLGNTYERWAISIEKDNEKMKIENKITSENLASKSLIYYEKSLDFAMKLPQFNTIRHYLERDSYFNIANCCIYLKQYDRAMAFFSKALEVCSNVDPDDHAAKVSIYLGKGITSLYLKRYLIAKDYMKQALDISNEIHNFNLFILQILYMDYGCFLIYHNNDSKNYNEGISLLQKCIKISKNLPEIYQNNILHINSLILKSKELEKKECHHDKAENYRLFLLKSIIRPLSFSSHSVENHTVVLPPSSHFDQHRPSSILRMLSNEQKSDYNTTERKIHTKRRKKNSSNTSSKYIGSESQTHYSQRSRHKQQPSPSCNYELEIDNESNLYQSSFTRKTRNEMEQVRLDRSRRLKDKEEEEKRNEQQFVPPVNNTITSSQNNHQEISTTILDSSSTTIQQTIRFSVHVQVGTQPSEDDDSYFFVPFIRQQQQQEEEQEEQNISFPTSAWLMKETALRMFKHTSRTPKFLYISLGKNVFDINDDLTEFAWNSEKKDPITLEAKVNGWLTTSIIDSYQHLCNNDEYECFSSIILDALTTTTMNSSSSSSIYNENELIQQQQQQSILSLSHKGLLPFQLNPLLRALINDSSIITTLDLSGNNFDDICINNVCITMKSISTHQQQTALSNLRYFSISSSLITDNGYISLFSILATRIYLEELDISLSRLSVSCLPALQNLLLSCQRLRCLSLEGCRFLDWKKEDVGILLSAKRLQHLNVANYTSFPPSFNFIAILNNLIATISTGGDIQNQGISSLTKLDISGVYSYIEELPIEHKEQQLKLDEIAKSIGDILKYNHSLISLEMRQCNIINNNFSKYLNIGLQSKNCTLQSLDLSYCNSLDILCLSKGLQYNNSLHSLNLSGNIISIANLLALKEAILNQKPPILQVLQLHSCQLYMCNNNNNRKEEEEIFLEIINSLFNNIFTLDLSYNSIPLTLIYELVHVIAITYSNRQQMCRLFIDEYDLNFIPPPSTDQLKHVEFLTGDTALLEFSNNIMNIITHTCKQHIHVLPGFDMRNENITTLSSGCVCMRTRLLAS